MGKKAAVAILFFSLFFSSTEIDFAYDDNTTHPALTDEIVDFYNSVAPFEDRLNQQEKEWVVEGSTKEDTPPRWLNHFYDPTNGAGWTGEHLGSTTDSDTRKISDTLVSPLGTQPVSAVKWINDYWTQEGSYKLYGGNRTWKKGLEYYAEGNKKDAYINLGSALHLLEDMTVPEHTRNDSHPHIGNAGGDPSPFEDYLTKWTRQNIKDLGIVDSIRKKGLDVPSFNSIEDYLISTATYSNKYFFSKDTINDPKYQSPKIVREDGNLGYGVDENGKEFPLVNSREQTAKDGSKLIDYFISTREEGQPILDAYFTRLSQKAVLNGAGVILLFKHQAEDEKVNEEFQKQGNPTAYVMKSVAKAITPPGISIGSEFARLFETFKSIGSIAAQTAQDIFSFISTPLKNLLANNQSTNQSAVTPNNQSAIFEQQSVNKAQEILVKSDNKYVSAKNVTTNPVQSENNSNQTIPENSFSNDTVPANPTPKVTKEGNKNKQESTPQTVSPGNGGGGGSSGPVGGAGSASDSSSQSNSLSEDSQSNSSSSQNGNSSSNSSSSSETSDSNSTSSSSSSGSANHILISEILFNPSGDDEGKEFIELYNPTNDQIELEGWSLKYKKENATATVSLASFKSSSHPEDRTLIPTKGFILIGLNSYDSSNYAGKSADITRTGALPNGEMNDGQAESAELILYNASSSEVDKISYDKNSISNEGQSFERQSFSNNVCISAQASSIAGEFLGNGCDTDDVGDFEIRTSPNPQNSDSLPEPRNAPPINNLQVTYDFAPSFGFSWDLSNDSSGATSTLSYFIYDTSSPSSTVVILESAPSTSTTPTSTSYSFNEVGRNYDFQFKVQDSDGLSNSTTTTVFTNSFLDKIFFYHGTSTTGGGYFLDITTTSSRPFWDTTNASQDAGWKAIVFYLNKDAPKEGQLSTDNQLVPSDNSYARLSYDGCGGGGGNVSELIFPFNSASCIPGPLSAGAYNFSELQDSRLTVGVPDSNSGVPFSPSDYVTLAFYDFGGGGGGSQRLSLAAVDKTKYYFSDIPQNQNAPTTPENFSANYDSANGKLNLGWSSSTDADTLDYLINYQVNYSTSSVLSDSDWRSVGTSLSTSTVPAYPNSYKIGLRAIDNFNNTSTQAVVNWNFPDGFVQLPSQSDHGDIVGNAGGSQKFSVSTAASISAVALWGEPEGGSYNNSQSYVQIRKDNNDLMNGEILATSTSKTMNQHDAPRELVYTFDAPVQLEASSSYWIVTFPGPSETTNGTIYYGDTADSYPDGYWSAHPSYDTYFRFIQ